MNTCSIDGCDKAARSATPGTMCPMHYHRAYRHGSPDITSRESSVSVHHGRRYRTVAVAGHPLASKSGRAYEHRVVLYEAIGPGVHACHWCGTDVEWLPRWSKGELQVDHLNSIGDDNRAENLVPACARCNTARGSQRRADALREAGWWANHDTIAGLRTGGRSPRVA